MFFQSGEIVTNEQLIQLLKWYESSEVTYMLFQVVTKSGSVGLTPDNITKQEVFNPELIKTLLRQTEQDSRKVDLNVKLNPTLTVTVTNVTRTGDTLILTGIEV